MRHTIEWAVAHEVLSLDDAMFTAGYGEHGLTLAGPGAPLIGEAAVVELAAALGVSTEAGASYVGDSLEIRYRLPKLWERVASGACPVWRARRVAQATIHLCEEGAAFVDTHVAPFAHSVSWAQLDRLVGEALIRWEPEAAEEKRKAAAERRHVTIHDDSPAEDGTVTLDGCLDLADARDLNTALAQRARSWAASGPPSRWTCAAPWPWVTSPAPRPPCPWPATRPPTMRARWRSAVAGAAAAGQAAPAAVRPRRRRRGDRDRLRPRPARPGPPGHRQTTRPHRAGPPVVPPRRTSRSCRCSTWARRSTWSPTRPPSVSVTRLMSGTGPACSPGAPATRSAATTTTASPTRRVAAPPQRTSRRCAEASPGQDPPGVDLRLADAGDLPVAQPPRAALPALLRRHHPPRRPTTTPATSAARATRRTSDHQPARARPRAAAPTRPAGAAPPRVSIPVTR